MPISLDKEQIMKIYYAKASWHSNFSDKISHMIVSAESMSAAASFIENELDDISNLTIEEWTYDSAHGIIFLGDETEGQETNPFLFNMIEAIKKENDY